MQKARESCRGYTDPLVENPDFRELFRRIEMPVEVYPSHDFFFNVRVSANDKVRSHCGIVVQPRGRCPEIVV